MLKEQNRGRVQAAKHRRAMVDPKEGLISEKPSSDYYTLDRASE